VVAATWLGRMPHARPSARERVRGHRRFLEGCSGLDRPDAALGVDRTRNDLVLNANRRNILLDSDMAVEVGQLFGNYRMVRLLGEGGFGEVYLVENPLIQRRAAVKVLHTELARDAELVRRFLNEARAASAIRHPNIIDVFDAGGMPGFRPAGLNSGLFKNRRILWCR